MLSELHRTNGRFRVVLGAIGFWMASQALPRPALADPPPARLRVATWNLEWFFDERTGDNYSDLARSQSAPSREEWNWKRDGVAAAIAELKPEILAVQEAENQQVLYYLTRRLSDQHHETYHSALIQGQDFGTEQDVGFLYRDGLLEISRREQSREMRDSHQYYNLPKHMFARFEWGSGANRESVLILNVHLRAASTAASIRQRQARLARAWIEPALRRGDNIIVLGDLNTDELASHVAAGSDLSILLGDGEADPQLVLTDLNTFLPVGDRQTHLAHGREFDHILVSRSLMQDDPQRRDLMFRTVARRRDVVVRGQGPDADHFDVFYQIPQAERDLSDHYPVVADFEFR